MARGETHQQILERGVYVGLMRAMQIVDAHANMYRESRPFVAVALSSAAAFVEQEALGMKRNRVESGRDAQR